ncbi:Alpha/Beta hydrolase protein [Xylariales sp. AK1849]|nr:Alpha/Beta hydrolase protein [Xylariales sp. AK1849]
MTPSSMIQEDIPTNRTLANPIHPEFLARLDEDFINYYNQNLGRAKPTNTVPVQKIRINAAQYRSPTARDFSSASCVQDIKLAAGDGHLFTARLYKPDPRTSPYGAGPYPVHLNFHGGGFTSGDLTSDAQICMQIRTRLGIIVADIDYRLRPEHGVGKGHEDCWSAVQWIYRNSPDICARSDSISIGGISAGGQIGAVVQQFARDKGIPLKLAFLGVPSVVSHAHYEKPSDSEFASFVENEFAPCLNWARIMFFREKSKSDKNDEEEQPDRAALPDVYANPLYGNLNDLCDTFIATASADPLRDEGEFYGQKLIEASVKTTVRRYDGVPHPFMHMPIKKAQMYLYDLCEALRSAHNIGFLRRRGFVRRQMLQSKDRGRFAGMENMSKNDGKCDGRWTRGFGKLGWGGSKQRRPSSLAQWDGSKRR